MATLSEHAEAIMAAIDSAVADGLTVEFDLSYDYDGTVEVIEFDLWDTNEWVTVFMEDRT